ncbi:hypothetical protein scyTo_0007826 [Scyliorhinus torazame]|uniref:Uncharacterized protein n=1 Tax=Scyliorhinus torazame TaxID=75743 RepID=A0A401NZ02_SCYTO|nr:hypothetical protein [Scyliorhinus torazame]
MHTEGHSQISPRDLKHIFSIRIVSGGASPRILQTHALAHRTLGALQHHTARAPRQRGIQNLSAKPVLDF